MYTVTRCCILLSFLAQCSAASQTVLWVATDGGDTTTCGEADSPCHTIAHALEQFPGADAMTSNATIRVKAGVYGVPSIGINFAGRPVMIQGEAGVVVDCNGSPRGFVATANEPRDAVTCTLLLPLADVRSFARVQGLTRLTVRNCGTDVSSGSVLLIAAANISVRNCTIESNHMANFAVQILSGYPLFHSVVFSKNVARRLGGAVLVNGGDVLFEQCHFELNQATDGGAMYINGGTTTLNSSRFTSNTVGGYGGAVFLGEGDFSCIDCQFDLNQASYINGGGGALRLQGGGTVIPDGSTFTNNTAVRGHGGGIFMDGGELSCASCHFKHNHATTPSTYNMDGRGSGGAIYTQNGVEATLDGSTFMSNSAVNGNGGSVYMKDGDLSCVLCHFEFNLATKGGAIASALGCTLTLDQATYVSNTAEENGGALWLELSRQFTWIHACVLVQTVVQAFRNRALQAGGFAFFYGATQEPPTCIVKLLSLVRSFGSAGLYGGGFATTPTRSSVLSVQGRIYSPTETIPVHPSEPISLRVSIVDAFGQPCLQDPTLGVNIVPEPSSIRFIGSLQTSLNGTGIASFDQASTFALLQGAENQCFNLSVNSGAPGMHSSIVKMIVADCPAGYVY